MDEANTDLDLRLEIWRQAKLTGACRMCKHGVFMQVASQEMVYCQVTHRDFLIGETPDLCTHRAALAGDELDLETEE